MNTNMKQRLRSMGTVLAKQAAATIDALEQEIATLSDKVVAQATDAGIIVDNLTAAQDKIAKLEVESNQAMLRAQLADERAQELAAENQTLHDKIDAFMAATAAAAFKSTPVDETEVIAPRGDGFIDLGLEPEVAPLGT